MSAVDGCFVGQDDHLRHEAFLNLGKIS